MEPPAPDSPLTSLDLNTPDSIQNARAYAGLLGTIPSSFTVALRGLINDQEKNGAKLSPGMRFQVLRLARGPSFLSPFYYASVGLKGSLVDGVNKMSVKELVALYTPAELCSLIGTIYLYRKAKHIVDDDEWKFLVEGLQERLDIGFALGSAIPAIGGGLGMLVAGLPQLAFAAFHKHDKKGFKEYRRQIQKSGKLRDINLEMRQWACTSIEIAAVFVQVFGFGVTAANSFTRGLLSPTLAETESQKDCYHYRIAHEWITALALTGAIPEITHRGEYYPTKERLKVLLEVVGDIRDGGTKIKWLDKTKEDISEQSTPYLFQDAPTKPTSTAPKAAEATEAPAADGESEPEALLDESLIEE